MEQEGEGEGAGEGEGEGRGWVGGRVEWVRREGGAEGGWGGSQVTR